MKEKKKVSRGKLKEDLLLEFGKITEMLHKTINEDDDELEGAAAPDSPGLVPRWIKENKHFRSHPSSGRDFARRATRTPPRSGWDHDRNDDVNDDVRRGQKRAGDDQF